MYRTIIIFFFVFALSDCDYDLTKLKNILDYFKTTPRSVIKSKKLIVPPTVTSVPRPTKGPRVTTITSELTSTSANFPSVTESPIDENNYNDDGVLVDKPNENNYDDNGVVINKPDENDNEADYVHKPYENDFYYQKFPDNSEEIFSGDPKSNVFNQIIEYIKHIALENAKNATEERERSNFPVMKTTTDTFEFGFKGKGRIFFKKTGVLAAGTDFVRVPLINIPKCHEMTYVSVVLTRGDSIPPVVHLDLKSKLVVIGYPLRSVPQMPEHMDVDFDETLYQIEAYSERNGKCVNLDGK